MARATPGGNGKRERTATGRLTGLPPVAPPGCTVLVLGSMPGDASLARAEYYAHPRNRFWRVMGELCGAHAHLDYDTRLERLGEGGVALWDVLRHCVRAGSLDTKILPGSEVPNDVPGLLAREPRLCVVALNGAKAAETFRRRILAGLDARTAERLTLLEMPSTSPANASWSLERLLGAWGRLVPFLNPAGPPAIGPRSNSPIRPGDDHSGPHQARSEPCEETRTSSA